MNELDAPPQSTTIFAGRSAANLGLALLAGLALVAALGIWSRPKAAELEHFQQVSAVGDAIFFIPPELAQKPPPAAVTWDGKPLYPVSYKKLDLHETKMVRAGRDPQTGLSIYRSLEPVAPQPGEREKKGEPMFFLKIGPGAFIKVRASTPGM